MINIEEIPEAKEELKKIRDRFYGWMKNGAYLRLLIAEGKMREEDIRKKNFKNKDMGECELIAIAKTSVNDYEIVTDDAGKVFLHPEQNLFNDYAIKEGITVICSNEWLNKIGYKE